MSTETKQETRKMRVKVGKGDSCCAPVGSCCATSEITGTEDQIRRTVRENYARVATTRGTSASSCCGTDKSQDVSVKLGYSEEELGELPEGANLGLGCGNPIAMASLKEGETVIDLGSGAGIDCFIAASKVGKSGKVIGVDMTPEMIERARENARKSGNENVEFRLGEIEHLPVADNSADVIISNCVINLAPDKSKVFQEAFRVLKPGGRLMVSDIVLLKELPEAIRNSVEAYVGCIAGAMKKEAYLDSIRSAGLQDVKVMDETTISLDVWEDDPNVEAIIEDSKASPEQVQETADAVASIKAYGVKPIAS
ncbi:arsenite methyltransferase [Candidatus Poribacteria bacterium]